MPSEIVMPRLGWTMEAGTVVEWLKASGDPVEAGEHIFAVESDKAIIEVESLDSGVLYIPDATPIGVEVPVGQALGFILGPGETPPAYSFGGRTASPEPQDFGKPIDDDIPTNSGPAAAVQRLPWPGHAGQPAGAPGGGRAGRRSDCRDRHRQGRPYPRAGRARRGRCACPLLRPSRAPRRACASWPRRSGSICARCRAAVRAGGSPAPISLVALPPGRPHPPRERPHRSARSGAQFATG